QLADNTEESGYSAELQLLDPATRPSGPSGAPNRSMLTVGLGISVVVGILLSIGYGLFLDDRVYAPSEIDDLGVVPVIGIIPKSKPVKKATRWRLRG
ncbi:MAG: protein kinase, partial [Minicystis sp.]